jgi:type IV secretory pathway TrbD component
MWIILGFGWLGILFAGVSLFRIASYADKKVRGVTQRPRPRSDWAA